MHPVLVLVTDGRFGDERQAELARQIAAVWDSGFQASPDDYVKDLLGALLLEDPWERARAITRFTADAQRWVGWLSDQRDLTLRELRATGAGYEKIAEALGLHKTRIRQLVARLDAEDGAKHVE